MQMRKAFWVIVALLVVSAALNFHLVSAVKSDVKESVRESYEFLSPRIFVEDQNDILINFVDLRLALRNELLGVEMEKVGVYFEYLPSGVSIGIHEKNEFVIASLLKVPMVMAIYKEKEKYGLDMNEMLTVQENDIDPYFGDLWKNGLGTKLTINEAVRHTLIDSDNTAKNLLFHRLSEGSLENIFDALDIPKDLESNAVVVTPKNYSSILRSLYLSSYLEMEHSEEILDLLTQTNFNDKLRAGIPENIKVAHKIGVYSPGQVTETYSDCGIIYVPKRPYILCLMHQGDEESSRQIMSKVSKMVYEYVSKANPANL